MVRRLLVLGVLGVSLGLGGCMPGAAGSAPALEGADAAPATVAAEPVAARDTAPGTDAGPEVPRGVTPIVREDPPADGFPRPTEPPTPPAQVSDPSEAGAQALARYWFLTLNWSVWSNDAGPLAQASSVECDPCRRAFEDAADRVTDGQRVDGGMTRVDSVAVRKVVSDELLMIDVHTTQETGRLVAADAPAAEAATTRQVHYVLGVAYTGGRWVVADLGVPQ